MPLDSINPKPKTSPKPDAGKNKSFIIPIIIIILAIAVIWLFVVRYNFSRLTKNENQDSGAKEINTALENLTEEFDKFKEKKVFSQTKENTAPTSSQNNSESQQPQPPPPNQY